MDDQDIKIEDNLYIEDNGLKDVVQVIDTDKSFKSLTYRFTEKVYRDTIRGQLDDK
jgi:hypothetical protein